MNNPKIKIKILKQKKIKQRTKKNIQKNIRKINNLLLIFFHSLNILFILFKYNYIFYNYL